jgi:hypothetical protein
VPDPRIASRRQGYPLPGSPIVKYFTTKKRCQEAAPEPGAQRAVGSNPTTPNKKIRSTQDLKQIKPVKEVK